MVIGGASTAAALHASSGKAAFFVTLLLTVAAARALAGCVTSGLSSRVPVCLVGVGATYGGFLAGHRAGPLSAGLVGLALLALAQLTHREILLVTSQPAPPPPWGPRATLAVVTAAAVLDTVIALVSRGGRPDPGSPSTLAVAAGCVTICALVAAVTALADGAVLPRVRAARASAAEPPDDGSL